ncbi:hypothetical protein Hanom_Chr00s000001g01592061 [Helianthus anomalus]
MTKMTTRSSLVTSPEKDNTPQSQNLLMNPSSDIYKFTNPEIESHAPCFPLENVFRPFDPLVCNDASFPVWICFPTLPLLLGFFLPFSRPHPKIFHLERNQL